MANSPNALKRLLAAVALFAPVSVSGPAAAQYEPFIGQIGLFGFNFCPRFWAPAEGQLMKIADNQALYSLLGTMYGGDGRETFALPDLRGRAPIGVGTADGQIAKKQGDAGGAETVTLAPSQLPAHTHAMRAASGVGNAASPGDKVLSRNRRISMYRSAEPDVAMAAGAIGETGGGEAVPVRDPYLVMKWCVAVQGIYPARS